jgi:hypothetical protein
MSGNDAFAKLLLHMDGADGSTTFIDSSAAARTMTAVGNVQIDTTQSVFGGASGLFDGTGDVITAAGHADFNFTGDFTFDCRMRMNGANNPQALIGVGGQPGGQILVRPTGAVLVYAANSLIVNAGAVAFGATTWYHIAVVRVGTAWTVYRDGVSYATGTSANTWGNATDTLEIGDTISGAFDFGGWMDEVRLSNIARWTADFTPPTEEYSLGVVAVFSDLGGIQKLNKMVGY